MSRSWWWGAGAALLAGAVVNVSLTLVDVAHDPLLVTLLALAAAATAVVVVEATGASTGLPWTTGGVETRHDTGEDLRTEEFRWLVEAHISSRGADDAVVWKIADLADRRLRQAHGFRYADDPERAAVLLGPILAEWVSHDRRHRYDPAHRRRRYSLAQLAGIVRRIEEL